MEGKEELRVSKRFSNPFEIPKDMPGIGAKRRGKKAARSVGARTDTLRANSPTLDRAGEILYGSRKK